MNIHAVVPQEDLDAVEEARKKLFDLAEKMGWLEDTNVMIAFQNITGPMWRVGNRKYETFLQSNERCSYV